MNLSAKTRIGLLCGSIAYGLLCTGAWAQTTDIAALQEKADSGDAAAQYKLGVLLEGDDNTPPNYAQAVLWIRKSADQGYPAAENELGILYEHAEGVPFDEGLYLSWVQKAADQNYPPAEDELGSIYLTENSKLHDYAKAAVWFKKAADQGYAKAEDDLGNLYRFGRGVKQNYGLAAELYKRAADKGHTQAAVDLGVLYINGQGVSKSQTQALALFKKATDKGDSDASSAANSIAHLYAAGVQIPRDYKEAYFWCGIAIASGYPAPLIEPYRDRNITPHLDHEKIVEIQKRVDQWAEDHKLQTPHTDGSGALPSS